MRIFSFMPFSPHIIPGFLWFSFLFWHIIQLESIGEDTAIADKKPNFVPVLRSGEWSDIGRRSYMEDTHICIGDLAKKSNHNAVGEEAVSFYGVSHLTELALYLFINFMNSISFFFKHLNFSFSYSIQGRFFFTSQ